MRVTDETVYNLLSSHSIAEMFEQAKEMQEIRSQIDQICDFEKLEKRYSKISDRVCWLRTARDTTITIVHEDNTETIMNRLEYEREKGRISHKDEQIIEFAIL